MRRMWTTWAPAAAALWMVAAVALGGCKNQIADPLTDAGVAGEGEGEGEGEGDDGCPDVPVLGLIVILIDTTTNFHICDAQVQIHDGNYAETLGLAGDDGGNPQAECRFEGARDRPGNYAVHIVSTGHPTTDDSEVVPADDCDDPVTSTLTVELGPA